jgi:hypothetical protein
MVNNILSLDYFEQYIQGITTSTPSILTTTSLSSRFILPSENENLPH